MSNRMMALVIIGLAQICTGFSGAHAQGVRAFISVYIPEPQVDGEAFQDALDAEEWLRIAVAGDEMPDFTQADWSDNVPAQTTLEATFIGKAISSSPEYSSYIWEVVLPNQAAALPSGSRWRSRS